jgi:hypothetical protein
VSARGYHTGRKLSPRVGNIYLLGMSGSLRWAAPSTAIFRTLARRLPAGVEMTIVPLSPLPLYNEDEDRADPARQKDIKPGPVSATLPT